MFTLNLPGGYAMACLRRGANGFDFCDGPITFIGLQGPDSAHLSFNGGLLVLYGSYTEISCYL
jgi:hypothetical protein